MPAIIYANETHPWYGQLMAWVGPIMECIYLLSEGVPQAWAQITEHGRNIEFELRVEWYDRLMQEVLVETFTQAQNK